MYQRLFFKVDGDQNARPAISFGVIYDIINRPNCIKYGPTFNECVLIRMY